MSVLIPGGVCRFTGGFRHDTTSTKYNPIKTANPPIPSWACSRNGSVVEKAVINTRPAAPTRRPAVRGPLFRVIRTFTFFRLPIKCSRKLVHSTPSAQMRPK